MTTMTTMRHDHPDSVLDRFRANVVKFPDKLAVAFLQPPAAAIQEQRTYQQLDEETTRLAGALLQRGLSPGDRYVRIVAHHDDDYGLNFVCWVLIRRQGGDSARSAISNKRDDLWRQPKILYHFFLFV
jgi:acyl-CoA synthetase (AMP-forming)/AMP-acid ligase II